MDYRIRLKGIAVSVIASAALLGIAGMALAAEFSADMKQSMPGPNGNMTMNTKIFVKGQMERRESSGPMGKMVTIIRRDKGVMWMLMPAQKSFMEQPMMNSNPKADPIASILKRMPNYKKAGTAKIAGYVCDKYTFKNTERKSSGTAYISPELKMELKMEMQSDRGKMSYVVSNIKQGKQANSLFNIPSGFKKMAMPSMGGMGGPGMGGPGMRGPGMRGGGGPGMGMPGMGGPGRRGGRMGGMSGMPGMPPPAPK